MALSTQLRLFAFSELYFYHSSDKIYSSFASWDTEQLSLQGKDSWRQKRFIISQNQQVMNSDSVMQWQNLKNNHNPCIQTQTLLKISRKFFQRFSCVTTARLMLWVVCAQFCNAVYCG